MPHPHGPSLPPRHSTLAVLLLPLDTAPSLSFSFPSTQHPRGPSPPPRHCILAIPFLLLDAATVQLRLGGASAYFPPRLSLGTPLLRSPPSPCTVSADCADPTLSQTPAPRLSLPPPYSSASAEPLRLSLPRQSLGTPLLRLDGA
eukprot:2407168-Rhodomonas_salina.1